MRTAAKLAFIHNEFETSKQLSLIVMHGMLGSKNNFRSVVKNTYISQNLKQAYLLDLRNHGDSEKKPSMSVLDLADDMKHFIDSHKIKDAVLMGHSFGGRKIYSYLQHHPEHSREHLKGVVIVDILPTPFKSGVPDLMKKLFKVNLHNRTLFDLKNEIQSITNDAGTTALVMSSITSETPTKNNNQLNDFHWKFNLKSIIDAFDFHSSYQFDFQWEGPVRIICGEKSEYVQSDHGPLFAKVINPQIKKVFPNLDQQKDLIFIQGSGHWVHAEKPREFIQALGDFLKDI